MIPDATGSESRSPDAGHLTGGWALHEHAAFGTDEPLDTPEAPIAVTTMMGRPIHPRGRRLGGGRIRR
jgi:hypothetical protein